MTYDPENRLTAVGTVLTAGYRGDGLRAWKQSAAGRTYFLYSGSRLIAEMDPHGYKGQWGYYRDPETGLLLLTHRYYDPGTGRFVTRDPIGYVGGVQLYGYAAENPVVRADPSGLADSLKEGGGGGGDIGGGGGDIVDVEFGPGGGRGGGIGGGGGVVEIGGEPGGGEGTSVFLGNRSAG